MFKICSLFLKFVFKFTHFFLSNCILHQLKPIQLHFTACLSIQPWHNLTFAIDVLYPFHTSSILLRNISEFVSCQMILCTHDISTWIFWTTIIGNTCKCVTETLSFRIMCQKLLSNQNISLSNKWYPTWCHRIMLNYLITLLIYVC